ncbi:uncharacterized protein BX664DRAFT_329773, partial [Halteromyces radiatus]|uniref:uncharacterized protein n=1 Tax=Halteromyces radiatus TaxID=101107 RepID=UPI00221F9145
MIVLCASFFYILSSLSLFFFFLTLPIMHFLPFSRLFIFSCFLFPLYLFTSFFLLLLFKN